MIIDVRSVGRMMQVGSVLAGAGITSSQQTPGPADAPGLGTGALGSVEPPSVSATIPSEDHEPETKKILEWLDKVADESPHGSSSES